MPVIAEQLRNYASAISDPTRGAILLELDRSGEATPTQLAKLLGLTSNNLYHHMRVLSELGVVAPPRAVPGLTYVEKYYHITPETQAALRLDYGWFERMRDTLTAEDRKAMVVGLCMTMAHRLRQAAREYESMDAEQLDRVVSDDKLLMLSINRLSQSQLESRLHSLRTMLQEESREFAEDVTPRTNLMIMAALPLLGKAEDEGTE